MAVWQGGASSMNTDPEGALVGASLLAMAECQSTLPSRAGSLPQDCSQRSLVTSSSGYFA
ncbi:protein of unknown function [Pseudomonas mediterranea]